MSDKKFENINDLPIALPLGFKEFEEFTDRILAQVGPGFENVPRGDIQFVLATTITHLGPQDCEKPDSHFIKTLRAAGAKQVAGGVFQRVKEEQLKKQEELRKQQEEKTAADTVLAVSDGQKE